MARYSSCLLILDRCEDMIRTRRAPFVWFLSQLLQQSSVKVVISSQTSVGELELPNLGDSAIGWSSLSVGQMRPRDAALLLLESCEREITPSELGKADDEPSFNVLDILATHELLTAIGSMPAAVRWCAGRLSDGLTIPHLMSELGEHSGEELRASIAAGSKGAPELAPHLSAAASLRRRQRPSLEASMNMLDKPPSGGAASPRASARHAHSLGMRLSPISSNDGSMSTTTTPPPSAVSSVGGRRPHSFREAHDSPPPPSPLGVPSPHHSLGVSALPSPSVRGLPAEAQLSQLRALRHAVQDMGRDSAPGAGGPGSATVSPEVGEELRKLAAALQELPAGGAGGTPAYRGPPMPHALRTRSQSSGSGSGHGSGRWRDSRGASGRQRALHSNEPRKLSWESSQIRHEWDMMGTSLDMAYSPPEE